MVSPRDVEEQAEHLDLCIGENAVQFCADLVLTQPPHRKRKAEASPRRRLSPAE